MSNVFLELNVETNIHVDMMTSPHILCLEVCSNPANALNPIFRIVLLVVIHLIMMIMIHLTMRRMMMMMMMMNCNPALLSSCIVHAGEVCPIEFGLVLCPPERR